MPLGHSAVTVPFMIRTATSSKLMLVADRRPGATDGAVAVRRYRLARVRLDGPRAITAGRTTAAGRP
jgi:hypothetical protein